MQVIIEQLIFGLFGGLVRSSLGIIKYLRTKKGKKRIDIPYLCFTLIASSLVGGFSSMLVGGDYKISLIAGYLGMDIIENLAKVVLKKEKLYRG